MKRIVKSVAEPIALKNYKFTHPVGTPGHDWDAFCDQSCADKRAVQAQVRRDQKGLCAYCEIDLALSDGSMVGGEPVKADFQIEHFHPKCDRIPQNRPVADCDWALYWPNLFGCCLGGTERLLVDKSRVAEKKRDHHCGARKRNKVLDNVILSPSQIPAFPCLFAEKRGVSSDLMEFEPNVSACQTIGPDTAAKADATLRELNLNCTLLARRRRAAVRKVFSIIERKMKRPSSFDEALEETIRQLYDPMSVSWPTFFTAIRIHFGKVVEDRLHAISYCG